MVVYLSADVKRHWLMSAEGSSWGFQVRKLKIEKIFSTLTQSCGAKSTNHPSFCPRKTM